MSCKVLESIKLASFRRFTLCTAPRQHGIHIARLCMIEWPRVDWNWSVYHGSKDYLVDELLTDMATLPWGRGKGCGLRMPTSFRGRAGASRSG